MNKAILIGRLGADPELRQTNSGKSVCNFNIATSRRYTTADGERKEDTQWHRIVVWGNQADNCSKYLNKGSQAGVEGNIQTREWEDKEGNKKWTTEIVAQSVEFLGSKKDGQGQNESPPTKDDDMPF